MQGTLRLALLLHLSLGLGLVLGCASSGPPPQSAGSTAARLETESEGFDEPTWSGMAKDVERGVKSGATAMGRGAKSGAVAVGRGLATAYGGIRNGYDEPESVAAFGVFPKGHVDLVRRYFRNVLRFSDEARYRVGQPVPGYMNAGILRGGKVVWQGFIVDVQVDAPKGLARQRSTRTFAVRIRDGDVIEAHKDDRFLRRYDAGAKGPVPAKRAP